MTGIFPTEDGAVLIKFKIDVSREYAPTQGMVEEELKKGLQGLINSGEVGLTIGMEDAENLKASGKLPLDRRNNLFKT